MGVFIGLPRRRRRGELDGRTAICRKNYRPGLIKLFDRLEADTEGRKGARGLVLFFGSGGGAAAIQFSFRRRRHAHILHTTNSQGGKRMGTAGEYASLPDQTVN